ncbi:MAG: hypothetical protein ACI8PZ_007131 [Myxococcota bacterium]|jgi:hypothetical protein
MTARDDQTARGRSPADSIGGFDDDPTSEVARAPLGRAPRPPAYVPEAPRNVLQTGVDAVVLEELILRYLNHAGGGSGRGLAEVTGLPLAVVRELIEALIGLGEVRHTGSNVLGDMLCELSERGRARAVESVRLRTAWLGAAPVAWEAFLEAIPLQSPGRDAVTPGDVRRATLPLVVTPAVRDALGAALTDGRSLLLHGPSGSGKTVLAERCARVWPDTVWIPRALLVAGVLVPVFDPAVHELAPVGESRPTERADARWVRIQRPTVRLDGAAPPSALALGWDEQLGTATPPAPLQAAFGVLLLDDVGHGDDTDALLYGLSAALDGRGHPLVGPDGDVVRLPLCWTTVLATDRDPVLILGDGGMRRMAHKVRLGYPTREAFLEALEAASVALGVPLADGAGQRVLLAYEQLDDLVGRTPRYSDAAGLLRAAAAWCRYERRPIIADEASVRAAVRSYLAGVT